ncbi:hypothetical protein ABEB36_000242 [Hypothenemus hampei]|uniref:Uncharacterized protein n=1 Tax=Hypothenemus hampei TaxID=57062 RepID=A0ABD1FCH5_HYPHA
MYRVTVYQLGVVETGSSSLIGIKEWTGGSIGPIFFNSISNFGIFFNCGMNLSGLISNGFPWVTSLNDNSCFRKYILQESFFIRNIPISFRVSMEFSQFI